MATVSEDYLRRICDALEYLVEEQKKDAIKESIKNPVIGSVSLFIDKVFRHGKA